MVRQLSLDFMHLQRESKVVPESYETELAMAFILAESKKKGKAKIKHLSPVSFPLWIVQTSPSTSVLLSAIGETTTTIEHSEDTAIGPIRRILTSEAKEFKDIPGAVDKALLLLKEVEHTTHTISNLLVPEVFIDLGSNYTEIDPNSKPNVVDLKIDSQTALTISQEYQRIVEAAKRRLKNIEDLQKVVQERLSDKLKRLENTIIAENERWKKRYDTLELSTEARMEKSKERLSNTIYRLQEKRKKDESAALADFTRDTAALETYLNQMLEEIKAVRKGVREEGCAIDEAAQQYRTLLDSLNDSLPGFQNVMIDVEGLLDQTVQRCTDLEDELQEEIREEEASYEEQTETEHQKLDDMRDEIEVKRSELADLKTDVENAVNKVNGAVNVRVEALATELRQIEHLSLPNDAISNLAPLTLLNVSTYVVNYNKGKPVVFSPIFSPADRFGLPFEPEKMDNRLDKFIQGFVKTQTKDSSSFVTAFEQASSDGNVFVKPNIAKSFSKGINDLFTRQLLNDGVKDDLEAAFTVLAGRCPACGEELGRSAKFCPECGASLV